MSCRCYIIPPHLLRGMTLSTEIPEHARKSAQAALEIRERYVGARKERFAELSRPRGYSRDASLRKTSQQIIPDTLLRYVADSDKVDDQTRSRARRDLEHLESILKNVEELQQGDQHHLAAAEPGDKPPKESVYRAVYDAHHNMDEAALPGKLVRAEGEPKVEDKDINEAFDNVGTVLDFYKEQFHWNSIDNNNANVLSTVHFGSNYENAFWDPKKLQMVFGDGDGFLNNFTGCIDVIGHELTHAVTEYTSPLDYWGMAGALNEHVSDVFGIMIKQKVQDEDSHNADWLIGEDCILPGVKGTALRSMKAPGTAYNDPRFGHDPQVANMSEWKTTFEDNGGVHIYSGIPNKAFYLASVAFGGYSWQKAGRIWWKTMLSGKIPPKCSFKQFADVTVDIALEEFDIEAANKVQKAWTDVGVLGKTTRGGSGGYCKVL